MKVDVHNHFYPGRYLELLEERGVGVRIVTDGQGRRYIEEGGARLVTLQGPMVELEARLRMMDEVGIDVQVLSLTSPNVYAFEGGDAVDVAQMVNDAYAEIKARYPDRFRCLASVPLGTGAEVDELNRALKTLGLDGVVVGTNVHGRPLEDPAFAPFWARVDELALPVLVHPMTPLVGTRFLDDYSLVPLVGFPFDTTVAVARMLFSGMLERYPRIRWILLHTGGAVPYLFGRLDIGYDAYGECRGISTRPSEILRRLFYDTIGYHPPALRCLVDSVGAEQMVFGTDYPHVIGDPVRVIRTLEETGLSGDDLEAIYWRNVRERLGIDLPG